MHYPHKNNIVSLRFIQKVNIKARVGISDVKFLWCKHNEGYKIVVDTW